MNEIARLQAWMNSNNYSMKRLAREMGISYISVYTMLIRREQLTNNFRWQFAQVFGWEEAGRLFESAPMANPNSEPEPA